MVYNCVDGRTATEWLGAWRTVGAGYQPKALGYHKDLWEEEQVLQRMEQDGMEHGQPDWDSASEVDYWLGCWGTLALQIVHEHGRYRCPEPDVFFGTKLRLFLPRRWFLWLVVCALSLRGLAGWWRLWSGCALGLAIAMVLVEARWDVLLTVLWRDSKIY